MINATTTITAKRNLNPIDETLENEIVEKFCNLIEEIKLGPNLQCENEKIKIIKTSKKQEKQMEKQTKNQDDIVFVDQIENITDIWKSKQTMKETLWTEVKWNKKEDHVLFSSDISLTTGTKPPKGVSFTENKWGEFKYNILEFEKWRYSSFREMKNKIFATLFKTTLKKSQDDSLFLKVSKTETCFMGKMFITKKIVSFFQNANFEIPQDTEFICWCILPIDDRILLCLFHQDSPFLTGANCKEKNNVDRAKNYRLEKFPPYPNFKKEIEKESCPKGECKSSMHFFSDRDLFSKMTREFEYQPWMQTIILKIAKFHFRKVMDAEAKLQKSKKQEATANVNTNANLREFTKKGGNYCKQNCDCCKTVTITRSNFKKLKMGDQAKIFESELEKLQTLKEFQDAGQEKDIFLHTDPELKKLLLEKRWDFTFTFPIFNLDCFNEYLDS